MAAVGGGVDEPRAAVGRGEHVAAPQVAVQARRRLGRPGELADALADALDGSPAGGAQSAALRGQVGERQQPALARRTSASPAPDRSAARARRCAAPRRRRRPQARRAATRRAQGHRPRAARPARARAPPRRRRRGRPRRPTREPGSAVGSRPPRRHRAVRQRTRLGQPAQTGGLGGVLARRRVGARLDERAPAAVELERARLVDRPAGRRPPAGHRGAGGAGHGFGQRARDAHAARTSSSRPRHAASTRSSTRSKPFGPP